MALRRFALGLSMLCAALALLVGLHAYLALRLVWDPGLPQPWRAVALGAIAAGAALLVLEPLGERAVRPPLSRLLAWPASLWMGLAFLLLVQLLASDLALWLVAGAASAALPGASGVGGAAGLRAGLVVGVALLASLVALRNGMALPGLVRIEIELRRWPRGLDGFRIVQISDLHIGPILGRHFAAEVAARVNALDPDLVAVTGDLVDGGVAQLRDEVEPLARLRSRHGVFFVTGNHDHYSGASAWAARVGELGMRVLRNRRVAVEVAGAGFDLAGVDDHRGDLLGGGGREDLDAALAGRDPERPLLLLAHDPSTFKRASRRGIDLQLSGHTHGGQLWPFAGFVRLLIPFVAGRYRRGGAELYVSRGTGFWGPPMRLRAPSEITEITLRTPAAPAAGHGRVSPGGASG